MPLQDDVFSRAQTELETAERDGIVVNRIRCQHCGYRTAYSQTPGAAVAAMRRHLTGCEVFLAPPENPVTPGDVVVDEPA